MGCTSSSDAALNNADEIPESKKIILGGLTVRYAYSSLRGRYPGEPKKPNQDSYSVTHNFGGKSSDAFFGVYDGHGPTGDKCAQFASDNIPKLIELYNREVVKQLKKDGSNNNSSVSQGESNGESSSPLTESDYELNTKKVHEICSMGHVTCNNRLHGTQLIDDSLSGTTAISAFIQGNRRRITICNVGDSRSVIGSKPPDTNAGGSSSSNSLVAVPLSKDQTPYRSDERARIRKTGARILTFGQICAGVTVDDGHAGSSEEFGTERIDESGDPPRVWAQDGEYPGTAFTRSIGDGIADQLGVFAVPEMMTLQLSPSDKILVLASDGVFEFLTNRAVIDICNKHNDPLEACRAVIKEARSKWFEYEDRADDITIICIYFDDINEETSSPNNNNAPTDEDTVHSVDRLMVESDDKKVARESAIKERIGEEHKTKKEAGGKNYRKTLITENYQQSVKELIDEEKKEKGKK